MPTVGIIVVMVRLKGDHDRMVSDFPIGDARADFFHDSRKLVAEGDFFEDEFVPRMVKPSVKVGTADSAVGYAK